MGDLAVRVSSGNDETAGPLLVVTVVYLAEDEPEIGELLEPVGEALEKLTAP